MVVVAFVLVMYITGMIMYKNKITGTVYVGNESYVDMDMDSIIKEHKEKAKEYKLTITSKDLDESVLSADDLGVGIDEKVLYSDLQTIMNDKSNIAWMLDKLKSKEYKVNADYTYNGDLVEKKVTEICKSKTLKKATNAKVKYDEAKKCYVIQEEDNGSKLEFDRVYEEITNAIVNEETSIDLSGCIKGAKITTESAKLKRTVDKLNKYLVNIKVDFGDREENIDADLIHTWIKVNKNCSVSFDKDKIKEEVIRWSEKYDTFGTTRKFKTHSGKVINISGGSYGWMIRRDYTVDRIVETIIEGKDAEMEPVYSYEGFRREKDEIGDTYIEVGLSEQHVWVYDKGKLVLDTPCVTGNVSLGHGTPSGVYPLNYKTRNATLSGQGYSTPVSYWMPFNNNIGLHDASWRSSFGGSIYRTGGSHGCVNLPVDKARQMYNLVIEKEPVIVY